MKMREVECFRCWNDGTWDTDFIGIPANTPEDKIEQAVKDAAQKIKWDDEIPWFVGLYHYSDDDAVFDEEPTPAENI